LRESEEKFNTNYHHEERGYRSEAKSADQRTQARRGELWGFFCDLT
jgi:hypothetical protein